MINKNLKFRIPKLSVVRRRLAVSRSKGMSLVELIIYLAILAIILVVIIDLSARLVLSSSRQSANVEVSQNLELAMSRLANTIEAASASSSSLPADTLTLTVGGQETVLALAGGVLTVQEGANAPVALTADKVNIGAYPADGQIFQKLTNGSAVSIKVGLTAALVSDPKIKQSITAAFVMRGK